MENEVVATDWPGEISFESKYKKDHKLFNFVEVISVIKLSTDVSHG